MGKWVTDNMKGGFRPGVKVIASMYNCVSRLVVFLLHVSMIFCEQGLLSFMANVVFEIGDIAVENKSPKKKTELLHKWRSTHPRISANLIGHVHQPAFTAPRGFATMP